MPGAEKIIERNIRKYLRERNYLTYKIHVGQYGPAGFPDLIVIKNGITSYLEVKALDEVLEPIQVFRMKELRQAGCIARPVWSSADAIRILEGDASENSS